MINDEKKLLKELLKLIYNQGVFDNKIHATTTDNRDKAMLQKKSFDNAINSVGIIDTDIAYFRLGYKYFIWDIHKKAFHYQTDKLELENLFIDVNLYIFTGQVKCKKSLKKPYVSIIFVKGTDKPATIQYHDRRIRYVTNKRFSNEEFIFEYYGGIKN